MKTSQYPGTIIPERPKFPNYQHRFVPQLKNNAFGLARREQLALDNEPMVCAACGQYFHYRLHTAALVPIDTVVELHRRWSHTPDAEPFLRYQP